MTDKPGRGTNPFDPTAEPVADPKPGHDDAVGGHIRPDHTPRRYEQPVEENEGVIPSDDSTLNTQI